MFLFFFSHKILDWILNKIEHWYLRVGTGWDGTRLVFFKSDPDNPESDWDRDCTDRDRDSSPFFFVSKTGFFLEKASGEQLEA